MRLLLLAAALIALPAAAAHAAGPCDTLTADARAVADKALAAIHPHDCCDATLDRCLAAAKPSRLVRRLADAVCTRAAAGQDVATISQAMTQRGVAMLGSGRPATIDTSAVAWAGAATAKVEIVAYVCTRCPYCARWTPALHTAVVEGGSLFGKARLALRPFPLSSHPGAKEGGLAMEAARSLGNFWPYLLLVMENRNRFQIDQLASWAATVGMDAAAFQARMDDPASEAAVVASKKEGLRNKVQGTPTVFINGKLYDADLGLAALTDAVLEEVDRVAGTLCQP